MQWHFISATYFSFVYHLQSLCSSDTVWAWKLEGYHSMSSSADRQLHFCRRVILYMPLRAMSRCHLYSIAITFNVEAVCSPWNKKCWWRLPTPTVVTKCWCDLILNMPHRLYIYSCHKHATIAITAVNHTWVPWNMINKNVLLVSSLGLSVRFSEVPTNGVSSSEVALSLKKFLEDTLL